MKNKIITNKRRFLAEIGKIVVLFNHLEKRVEFLTWGLIDASQSPQAIGRIITISLNYTQKVELVMSIIIERFGKEKAKKFFPIYNELKSCGSIRNTILHSQWFIEYGNVKENIPCSTQKIDWRKACQKGKKFNFSKAIKDIKLSELKSYSKKISKTINLISQFDLELFNSLNMKNIRR